MAYKYLDYKGVETLWGKIKDKDSATLTSAKSYTDTSITDLKSSLTKENGTTVKKAEEATKATQDGDGNTISSTYIKTSQKAVVNGVATLDANGKVPSSQLPSYVDDVIEYETLAAFPPEGEVGKIYVALDTNKIYRFSGTQYTVISETLSLGETADTAYSGASGKANAEEIEELKRLNSVTFINDRYNDKHAARLAVTIVSESDINQNNNKGLNYDTLKIACDKADNAVVGKVVGDSGDTTNVATSLNKFEVTIKDSSPNMRGNLEINENDVILGSNNDIWIGYIKNGSTISSYNESVNIFASDYVQLKAGTNFVKFESTSITMGSTSDPTDLNVNGEIYINGNNVLTDVSMTAITTSELEDILK